MNTLKLGVIIAAIALAVAACGETATKPNVAGNGNTSAVAATPAILVASGQELYATNCQICHKDTGKGGKVTVDGKKLDPEDLTSDKIKKRDDTKLTKDITDGYPDDGMPAFKDKLKPDEIKQIIRHIRTLQAGPLATS